MHKWNIFCCTTLTTEFFSRRQQWVRDFIHANLHEAHTWLGDRLAMLSGFSEFLIGLTNRTSVTMQQPVSWLFCTFPWPACANVILRGLSHALFVETHKRYAWIMGKFTRPLFSKRDNNSLRSLIVFLWMEGIREFGNLDTRKPINIGTYLSHNMPLFQRRWFLNSSSRISLSIKSGQPIYAHIELRVVR